MAEKEKKNPPTGKKSLEFPPDDPDATLWAYPKQNSLINARKKKKKNLNIESDRREENWLRLRAHSEKNLFSLSSPSELLFGAFATSQSRLTSVTLI